MKKRIAKMLLLIAVVISFASHAVAEQDRGNIVIEGYVNAGSHGLKDVEILIYENNSFEGSLKSSVTGRYRYVLEDDRFYMFIFRKPGYTDKILCVNTNSRKNKRDIEAFVLKAEMKPLEEASSCISEVAFLYFKNNVKGFKVEKAKEYTTLEELFDQIAKNKESDESFIKEAFLID